MKTAVLRLYRGDDARTAEAPRSPEAPGAAVTADLAAAPRVLPFPSRPSGRRDGADETARARRGAGTLRFHARHDGADAVEGAAGEAPDVLPLSAILSPPSFAASGTRGAALPVGAVAGRIGGWATTPAGLADDGPLTRAKALHANRVCKSCGAAGVEPVLLGDGVTDAAGDPVPGSGTLVGFHCVRCEREWPVA